MDHARKSGGAASSIAPLEVTLDDINPASRRRVEAPLTSRLDRLHLVLQDHPATRAAEASLVRVLAD